MDDEQNKPIEDLCVTLGKNSPLRQPVLSLLKDPTAPILDIHPVLSALINPSWLRRRERTVASWLITNGNWSEDQSRLISKTLSEVVDRAMQKMRPGRVILRWFADGLLLSFLLVSVIMMMNPDTFLHQSVLQACVEALVLYVFYTLVGSVFSMPYAIFRDNLRLRKLSPVVKALGQIGHSSALASLATTTLQSEIREVATSALQSVTTGLLPEDYGTLSTQTIPALCGALVRAPASTVLVILQALTMIGDERAIDSVERLLVRARTPEVRHAASTLLPILQQRAAENEASSMLLRASHSPADSGQTLLRATHKQSPIDPSLLLRMSHSEGSEDHTT